ncbi:DUF2637 domain-containing protein [Streptomyces taklimakanensis]|uniref:DUF2637 domain-containing protein n=1 Tax=Streptomyces taklimakanensis TaxID=2569853 RepID=UPI001EE4E212|nr:DUF2637 domain-containing protein [Streptomyces taklimakanensis]
MTTAPAAPPAQDTPEGEPQHQAGATPTPDPITLNRWQTIVIGVVAAGAVGIAALGFIGSYNAVADLAAQKGFHGFADWFPIAVDLGIAVFLALDLVLTRLRMPYPLLRYGAWLLTAATISFNAAVAWRPADRPATDGPDYLGAAMHAVIPLLFVIAVEAARHAVGRIANITADKHIESPPVSRWILAFPSTFRLYRWMRVCGIRAYDTALHMQRDIDLYIAELKKEHGRWAWRRNADPDALLVLQFAREGIPMDEARRKPAENRATVEQIKHDEEEARKDAEEKRRRAREEADRKRREAAEQEKRDQEETERQRRLAQEEEARQRRLAEEEEARQRRLAEEQQETELARQEAERRRLAAETEAAEAAARETARIEVETAQRIAAAQAAAAEAKANAEKLAAAARTDAERAAAQEAARAARAEADAAERLANAKAQDAIQRIEADRRERERHAAASRRASGAASRPANGAANGAANAASGAASRPANGAANGAANGTASRPANAASRPANAANGTAGTGRAIGIDEVVATYRQLASKRGKAPSDRELGEALEVSRSRAQQLRTEAIEAGHTDLAKPLRVA